MLYSLVIGCMTQPATKANTMSTIQISSRYVEAQAFVAWLNANGHVAAVVESRDDVIDGRVISADAWVSDDEFDALWSAYAGLKS